MNQNSQKAREIFSSGAYTCVFCSGSSVLTSAERGLRPLLALLDQGKTLQGYAAADKVVGKAPAMLYVLLGAESVYAPVMSRTALQVLQQHGIAAAYDLLVDGIQNRAGTGSCPMEAAVRHSETPQVALQAVRQAVATMQAAKKS